MSRTFDLLIVDDDPDQERITRLLMNELRVSHRCHYVNSGGAALEFLHCLPPFKLAPRPQLVLLDLNMPGMTGCEVLHEIKNDPELRSIPVIILSSSDRSADVSYCYSQYANAYIRKPMDLDSNLQVLREIERFWLDVVCLPE